VHKCRVVLDTNVLVSALGWQGLPIEILDNCTDNKYILVLSSEIISEVEVVLHREKFDFIPAEKKESFILLLMKLAENVSPTVKLDIIKADPTDNIILECAVAGNADYIVSGDKHLLDLKEFSGIQILKPAEFLKII